jgi:hypothetical protein
MQKILFTLLTIQILVGTINSQNCNSSPNWRVTKEDIPNFLNQNIADNRKYFAKSNKFVQDRCNKN